MALSLFIVQYHITDHLGSVRAVLNQSMTVLEQNDYYPFGLRRSVSSSATTNRYHYNGKEDISATATTDYGARQYSAEFCQWLQVDPLAEKNSNWSPYAYCFNNPINYIDPDGRDGIRIIDTQNKTITVRAVYFVQTADRVYYTTGGKTKFSGGYSEKQIEQMQTGINTYLNNLGLSVTEGDYSGYTIKFDLDFKNGGAVEQCKTNAQNEKQEGHSIGNSLTKGNGNIYAPFNSKEIENADGTVSPSTVGGVTIGNKDIMMNSSQDTKNNRIHEIFHTLGFSHPKGKGGTSGIMKYPPEKPNQGDANQIGNSTFLPTIILENEKK